MTRASILVGLVGFVCLAACVPPTDEPAPRGAAGVDTVPSAETAGTPFTTADGWTVTLEKLVLQVSVSATPESREYGSSDPYVFDARKPARMFTPALPLGTAHVTVTPYGRYIGYRDNNYLERIERINVDDETNERFNRLPDEGQDSQYTPGPSVVIAARAERGASVITLDLALNVTAISRIARDEEYGVPVDVRKNELGSFELLIDAKQIFAGFDYIARSDADRDGIVTASELEATKALTNLEQQIANAFVR